MGRRAQAAATLFIATGAMLGWFAPSSATSQSPAHPRLLFEKNELSAFRAKVRDGGADDDAYAAVRGFLDVYGSTSPIAALGADFGMTTIPNIGVAAYGENPPDAAALELGRTLTLYIANNYDVTADEAGSGERLRSLALGYDMFFDTASDSERALVRDEMVSYLETMVSSPGYHLYGYSPYLGNHSAMLAAGMGLAAICLDGEIDPGLVTSALAMADWICNQLIAYQIDPDGSYKEGVFYALWTMHNLIYYFEARKRYDGFDYGANPRVRAMEKWLAYELSPEGGAHSNNLNDSPWATVPFAVQTTYIDWATGTWGSGLAAWIREHTSGVYGVDEGILADKAGTALWYQPVPPVDPSSVLPRHALWLDRGLYYFRNGWPQDGAPSDDVVFSFYSGKFYGGHAQEDQDQFTLSAYGGKFAIDHGPGGAGRTTAAHNLILIDGAGQHYAGGSIGTDGRIAAYLMSDFADFLDGDATNAYSMYSQFNAPDHPVPGIDWSWGYRGANPVLFARRRVLLVDGGLAPYVVVVDDIAKDDSTHDYQWRMHTLSTNTVDVSSDPITIDAGGPTMDLYTLHPSFASMALSTAPFDNGTSEPDATVIRADVEAAVPAFAFLMLPRAPQVDTPTVAHQETPWGWTASLTWSDGTVDRVLRNASGGAVEAGSVSTDATLVVVRRHPGGAVDYLAVGTTSLAIDSTLVARCLDGTVGIAVTNGHVSIDRYDADYRVLDTGVTAVTYRGESLPFATSNGWISPGTPSAVRPQPANAPLQISAFPNPFNPSLTVRFTLARPAPVVISIFDAAGRRVRSFPRRSMTAGDHDLSWDGTNDAGRRVASGVFFVRVATPAGARTVKAVLVE